MTGSDASTPATPAKSSISTNYRAGLLLAALVAVAGVASFLLPWQWFLFLNPQHAEIKARDVTLDRLKNKLSLEQETRRTAEQGIRLAESDLNTHRNTLLQLARRQIATKVPKLFHEGLSLSEIVSRIKQKSGQLPRVTSGPEESIAER